MRWTAVLGILVVAHLTAARPGLAQSGCRQTSGDARPALDCFDLHPTSATRAAGSVRLLPPDTPFGVSVNPDGSHRFHLVATVSGLPDPTEFGAYGAYVAWATDPAFRDVQKLGPITNGASDLGIVAKSKFMLLVSAEPDTTVEERTGPLILRGQSPSMLLQPHDLLSLTPLAAFTPDETGHGHAHGEAGMPPPHPQVPMAPGMAGITPHGDSYLPLADDPASLPLARPRAVRVMSDGDTLRLVSGLVRRVIQGHSILMYGFNGQHPGPLIQVDRAATITVDFTNRLEHPTAIHWHGIRLDNRFDGVPGVTQDPVAPGESFVYEVHFPDAGIYWYHPHHREDIQQDLGLYGNILVRPDEPGYYNPVSREEVLMLDDLLLGDQGLIPYGAESANFMLMGRFGNVFLINSEPDYRLEVERGEVVRFFLTNVSNTRTFNLQFGEHSAKVIGSDIGRFEREQRVENIVIAPAERYVVEVLFDRPGDVALTNRVQALNHRTGGFFPEIDTLGVIHVSERPAKADYSAAFHKLRTHDQVVEEVDRYRPYFERPADHELVMTMAVDNLPPVVQQMMRLDPIYFNPVEWSDTMPHMNWIATGREVRWILRDPKTGKENMDIAWQFRRGDVIKLRIWNDRNAFHAMQHPIHIHGQRFLVLSRDGVPNTNMVWKDTVLLPVGSETDLLVDLANPGKWMVHCHIAEHLDSGMKMVIDVAE